MGLIKGKEESSRKLCLKEVIQNKHNEYKSIVKNQTSFIRPVNKTKYLEEYILYVKEIKDPIAQVTMWNHEENEYVESLQKDHSAIIKEADKWEATNIMDQLHCRELVL